MVNICIAAYCVSQNTAGIDGMLLPNSIASAAMLYVHGARHTVPISGASHIASTPAGVTTSSSRMLTIEHGLSVRKCVLRFHQ